MTPTGPQRLSSAATVPGPATNVRVSLICALVTGALFAHRAAKCAR